MTEGLVSMCYSIQIIFSPICTIPYLKIIDQYLSYLVENEHNTLLFAFVFFTLESRYLPSEYLYSNLY